MIDGGRETAVTLGLAGAAAVLAAAAWLTQPRINVERADAGAGGAIFGEMKLEDVKGLEVVDFDEKLAKAERFRVEWNKDGWTIPTKSDYPADAREALTKATTWMFGLKRDTIVTDNPKEHVALGVASPEDEKATAGVGTLFRVFDDNKNELGAVIVGKEVEGKPGFRYLREPKKDQVFRAELKDYSVSTRFRDWIEKDLLELSDAVRATKSGGDDRFKKNVDRIVVTDYQFDRRSVLADPKVQSQLTLDIAGSEFSPEGKLPGLKETEEVNNDKVRELIDGLKNLQIVDVLPKPPGLAPDLRVREGQELATEMASVQGIYIDRKNRGVVPANGEVVVETKEGIVYNLRFGNIDLEAKKEKPGPGATNDAKKEDGKKEEKKDETPKNRFVLITASFDEKKLPPIPAPPEPKPEAPKPGEKVDAEAQKKKLEAEKARLQAEVVEKRAKRDKAIQNGKLRAQELQERYDKWYYLVADETYKKVKVDRAALVKAKEKKEEPKSPLNPPNLLQGESALPGAAKPPVPAAPKMEGAKDAGAKTAPKAPADASKAPEKKSEAKAAPEKKGPPSEPLKKEEKKLPDLPKAPEKKDAAPPKAGAEKKG